MQRGENYALTRSGRRAQLLHAHEYDDTILQFTRPTAAAGLHCSQTDTDTVTLAWAA